MKRHPQARHRRSTRARTRRRSAASLSGVGVVALLAALSSPAGAAQPTTPGLSLAFFSGGQGASAHYVPADPNGNPATGKVIQLVNPLPTGNTYAGATVNNVAGMDMNSVSQLSFDVDTHAYLGAGAPRISVGLDDGTYLYLSTEGCSFTGSTVWQAAEFAATGANCVFYTSKGGPPQTWTAWTADLQDPTITGMALVQDEGPATAYVANVSLDGQVAN